MIYETKRLYVRDFKQGDFYEFHKLIQDPDIYKYMTWGPNSKEDTRKFIQKNMEQEFQLPRQSFDMPIIKKKLYL